PWRCPRTVRAAPGPARADRQCRDRGPRRGCRGAQRPLRGNGRLAPIGRPSGELILEWHPVAELVGVSHAGRVTDVVRSTGGCPAETLVHDHPLVGVLRRNEPLHSRESMKMDRRDFLKQTAMAGTGSFLLGGAPAYARSLAPSPNEKVRFACIGVGGKG